MKKIKSHYSGNKSRKFWKEIDKLGDGPDHQELYSLGCLLQNVEGYVLKQLKYAKDRKDLYKQP